MKNTLITLSILFSALTITSVQAATGCEAKKQDIQQELAMAREHGNTARVVGLEKALRETDEHCTESSLLKQRQEKVAEKQLKVQEREQDLAKAQAEGSSKKIEKQQRKLADAREELQEAQDALAQ